MYRVKICDKANIVQCLDSINLDRLFLSKSLKYFAIKV